MRVTGLRRQLPRSVMTHGVASLGLMAVHISSGATWLGTLWGIAAAALVVIRVAIRPAANVEAASHQKVQRHLRRAELQSLLSGLIWSAVPFVFAPSQGSEAALPLFILVAGMLTGFFSIFNQTPRMVAAYLLPTFILLLSYIHAFEMDFALLLSGMLVVLCAVMMTGSLGSARVLSDSVEMIERHAVAESRLSAAINTGDDAYGIFDPSGDLVGSNKAFSANFGDLRQLADLPREELIHEADKDRWLLVQQMAAPSGDVVVRLSDVTALKRAELVEVEARKHIESTSHQKTAFMRSITHELRTPLHIIMGYTDLLDGETRPDDQSVRSFASEIRSGSVTLLRVVNRVLRYVDLQDREQAPRCIPMKLGQDVSAWLNNRSIISKRRVEVVSTDVPEHMTLATDWKALSEALDELVDNALKHATQDSQVQVILSVDGGNVLFTVLDDGPGMASDNFQGEAAFATLSVHDEMRANGLGLGIALVAATTDYLGGTLSFEQREDVGMQVTISLPLKNVPAKQVS